MRLYEYTKQHQLLGSIQPMICQKNTSTQGIIVITCSLLADAHHGDVFDCDGWQCSSGWKVYIILDLGEN